MAKLAREGAKEIPLRSLAIRLTSDLQQKDYFGEACRLGCFVRDHIRYVRDIHGVEVIQTPKVTLTLGGGDCDDKSILLSAMLISIGFRSRFIALSLIKGQFAHVWVQVYIRGKWVDLEPTEPIPCGKRVPIKGVVDHMVVEI